jgi:hypothetical protein
MHADESHTHTRILLVVVPIDVGAEEDKVVYPSAVWADVIWGSIPGKKKATQPGRIGHACAQGQMVVVAGIHHKLIKGPLSADPGHRQAYSSPPMHALRMEYKPPC